MKNFKVGDVVRLPSGDTRMTVTASASPPWEVYCHWHDAEGKLHGAPFVEEVLLRVPPPPAGP